MHKTVRMDRELVEKVRDEDRTGRRYFSVGLMNILNKYFGGKNETKTKRKRNHKAKKGSI
jgi:hypothetical protein